MAFFDPVQEFRSVSSGSSLPFPFRLVVFRDQLVPAKSTKVRGGRCPDFKRQTSKGTDFRGDNFEVK